MVAVVGLVIMLFLGFLLGRIWEIRQQILLVEHVGKRQRQVENRVAEGSERPELMDRKPLTPADRQNEHIALFPAPEQLRRNGQAAFTGRFYALHQKSLNNLRERSA